MSVLIQTLITALVPILLQEAESLLGVKPNPEDTSWVYKLIAELVSLLQKYLPASLAPSVQEVEQLVAAEVEKLLSKVIV